MPCFLAILAYFFPRVVLVILFLFTNYLSIYQTRVWPLLGFIFLPLTTLAYALAINANGSVTGFYAFIMVIAALLDLGTHGAGPLARRQRGEA